MTITTAKPCGASDEPQIEGWFKTAKYCFALHCFGQATLEGVYRWLVLSLVAYILALWAYLTTTSTNLLDWGVAAQLH